LDHPVVPSTLATRCPSKVSMSVTQNISGVMIVEIFS
jgi:hypothetical protein